MHLRTLALHALQAPNLDDKLARVATLQARAPALAVAPAAVLAEPAGLPGRPPRPVLVPPVQVPQRGMGTPEGRAALIHAICHIEFNAINLALDAIWRFVDLPESFYREWLHVAIEEACHFQMLREHLQAWHGHDYGDFPAHDGLWTMCENTTDDVIARMALVPRTLEARGLDATPPMQRRLRAVGTPDALAACAILDVILRDEIGHVAIGNRWYGWLCRRQGLDPLVHYGVLAHRYGAPRLKQPFNIDDRLRAGFTPEEIAALDRP